MNSLSTWSLNPSATLIAGSESAAPWCFSARVLCRSRMVLPVVSSYNQIHIVNTDQDQGSLNTILYE